MEEELNKPGKNVKLKNLFFTSFLKNFTIITGFKYFFYRNFYWFL